MLYIFPLGGKKKPQLIVSWEAGRSAGRETPPVPNKQQLLRGNYLGTGNQ